MRARLHLGVLLCITDADQPTFKPYILVSAIESRCCYLMAGFLPLCFSVQSLIIAIYRGGRGIKYQKEEEI